MSVVEAKTIRKHAKSLLGRNRGIRLEPTPGYIFSIQQNRIGFKIVVIKLNGYDAHEGMQLYSGRQYNFVPYKNAPVCNQLVYSVDPRTGVGRPVGIHTMSEKMKVGWHIPDNGGPTATPEELDWLMDMMRNANQNTKLP